MSFQMMLFILSAPLLFLLVTVIAQFQPGLRP